MSGTERIRVMVVDDHPIYARGVIDCLSLESDIECVGTTTAGPEVLEMVGRLKPDVIIVDVLLSGTDVPTLASLVQEKYPGVALLALSDVTLDHLVVTAIRAGIDGYLLKDCDGAELANAIRVVHQGEVYLPPVIASKVVQHFRLLGKSRRRPITQEDGLTERELKVLELLASGKSNREIAEIFCLSERTVENHIRNIYRKLQVHGRTQATLVALQRGYVQFFASSAERNGSTPLTALR